MTATKTHVDSSAPMIDVRGLRVIARSHGTTTEIVRGVDFSVRRGEVLALIGESGSGKTTIALSLLGYARSGCEIAGGQIRIGDIDVLSLDDRARRSLRARTVAYVAQSASAGFNPARTIMDQVIEPALLHKTASAAQARAKAIELFRALALPSPETIGARYPHQVSGGQLQRLMAAMALITDPAVVVFDEPTTALDVTTQIEVLAAFKKVVRELGTTAVYVSHDLAVVAQMADQVVVLNGGTVRETGTTAKVLHSPDDAYTRELLAARRHDGTPPAPASSSKGTVPLLEIRGLHAGYGNRDRHGLPAVRVLDDVSLRIEKGSAVGVIGESGSGKTTLARVVAGLVPRARGEVLFDGRALPDTLSERTAEHYRRIQIVFQNADTALNPSHSIADILARPLKLYHGLKGDAAKKRTLALLDRVRLPATLLDRTPGGLSGGQKQRVNLARALAAEPSLILCDEVTSALDTVVGAAIIDLLAELRRELGLSYLFISHDISTVRAICDEVVVLYAGQRVESGAREVLSSPPWHPYTRLLIDSVPALRQGWLDERRACLSGALPPLGTAADVAELCAFRSRCPVRIDGKCNVTPPSLKVLQNGAAILCHHAADDLDTLQSATLASREPEMSA
ncbi:oligopeptide/dipeptide ABC transporter ATPase subunit [Pandoraea communis]|uniref:Oligopeptide/dipeptide ABC transporter ATPase subunit n=1 Tax=Pandoraea communis TaxID=2508297 RepID=A0A5E4RNL6_9BURK|nr:ABC transporter ATP-binding protein [Pandoraea communis]VVD64563.1 oligopeptide/dipeptide ABC transporter ATPase subunit [Pandoraea communis]